MAASLPEATPQISSTASMQAIDSYLHQKPEEASCIFGKKYLVLEGEGETLHLECRQLSFLEKIQAWFGCGKANFATVHKFYNEKLSTHISSQLKEGMSTKFSSYAKRTHWIATKKLLVDALQEAPLGEARKESASATGFRAPIAEISLQSSPPVEGKREQKLRNNLKAYATLCQKVCENSNGKRCAVSFCLDKEGRISPIPTESQVKEESSLLLTSSPVGHRYSPQGFPQQAPFSSEFPSFPLIVAKKVGEGPHNCYEELHLEGVTPLQKEALYDLIATLNSYSFQQAIKLHGDNINRSLGECEEGLSFINQTSLTLYEGVNERVHRDYTPVNIADKHQQLRPKASIGASLTCLIKGGYESTMTPEEFLALEAQGKLPVVSLDKTGLTIKIPVSLTAGPFGQNLHQELEAQGYKGKFMQESAATKGGEFQSGYEFTLSLDELPRFLHDVLKMEDSVHHHVLMNLPETLQALGLTDKE